MPADAAVEQSNAHLEDAPAVRPKVFFGETDPAARARLRRPTQFTDPLSPPPPRLPPLRRLPSPVQPRPVSYTHLRAHETDSYL
eukprot:5024289-Pleurochrysis_carterae.AAC.2